jgi:hypothetical protein
MADFRQDAEPLRDGSKDMSRVADTGVELPEFDLQVGVVLANPDKRTLPGYTVPVGLANGWIRDVTANINRLPAEWVQKARDAAVAHGVTVAPTFVGIMNDNGKATLILGWNR